VRAILKRNNLNTRETLRDDRPLRGGRLGVRGRRGQQADRQGGDQTVRAGPAHARPPRRWTLFQPFFARGPSSVTHYARGAIKGPLARAARAAYPHCRPPNRARSEAISVIAPAT